MLQKAGVYGTIYERGSEISDQFQIMLNELDAIAAF